MRGMGRLRPWQRLAQRTPALQVARADRLTRLPHLHPSRSPGPAASLTVIQPPGWPPRLVICALTRALRGQAWARLAGAKRKLRMAVLNTEHLQFMLYSQVPPQGLPRGSYRRAAISASGPICRSPALDTPGPWAPTLRNAHLRALLALSGSIPFSMLSPLRPVLAISSPRERDQSLIPLPPRGHNVL